MARILLAEDEEILRMLVLDTLEDDGHEIDEAHDGEEALQKIKANEYDLIILDYMMPVYTGLEVMEMVRGLAGKKHARILMLSAKSQASDQQAALQAGADYFMAKPFSPIQLSAKIEEILG
ncbi:response regulator [Bacillus sp. FJAT-42376]|uniref:response regulator transcription factor n=1 Tax=Bacillus sp. FJAT-42376 TaxID=2014076 RepID=UPI000F5164E1|nr:response regulator [Bacillus sp. FJAT-42376]AZB44194.1 response regulator [Bacillus sp. FJAT-42376]